MKTLVYIKREDPKPINSTFLCVKKKLVSDNGTRKVYEDIYVYEVTKRSTPCEPQLKNK